jgi:hypothetical protein
MKIVRIFFATFAITALFASLALTYRTSVQATNQECVPVDKYIEKSSDSTNTEANFDFSNSDTVITISADSGYSITESWLDVEDDNHSGYFKYANGPLTSYNPNPGGDINSAKARVVKTCPTPTPSPSPSPSPTPTPSASPSPTPEPSVEPTPTPTPSPIPEPTCEELQNCEVEPTPTPTPTATPSATPTPTPCGDACKPKEPERSVPTATVCADGVPGGVGNIYVDVGVKNDGKLEVRWSNASPGEGATQAHIVYGRYGHGAEHALLNTDNDGVEEIGYLTNGQNYHFRVALVNGCAVGEWSSEYDPMP